MEGRPGMDGALTCEKTLHAVVARCCTVCREPMVRYLSVTYVIFLQLGIGQACYL